MVIKAQIEGDDEFLQDSIEEEYEVERRACMADPLRKIKLKSHFKYFADAEGLLGFLRHVQESIVSTGGENGAELTIKENEY